MKSDDMSHHQINFFGFILVELTPIVFISAPIGHFWAKFGSEFVLLASLAFMIPFVRDAR